MPFDRLAHLMDRLAASRHRSKRQHLIQQIPFVWHNERRCCFGPIDHSSEPNWQPSGPTKESIALVGSFLEDPNDNVRMAAIVALGSPAPYYSEALRFVIPAIDSPCVPLRMCAARVLQWYGVHGQPAVGKLEEHLDDSVRAMRWHCARTLVEINPSSRLVPYLLDAARTSVIGFMEAVDGLDKLGCLAAEAIGPLRDLKEYINQNPDSCEPFRARDFLSKLNYAIRNIEMSADSQT